MDILGYLIGLLVGAALGYAFRGRIRSTIGTVGATAKLGAVKAKTAVVKDAVDAHAAVVADVHTAIEDLDKKL
jgi:uncharacterized membrane protein